MNSDSVEEILKKAGKAVAGLPEHLQSKAFELAVDMLTAEAGQPFGRAGRPDVGAAIARVPSVGNDGEGPDVADLLRASKRNPDRYLVFAQELEKRNEVCTTGAFSELFRTYRQDMPKLPARDLGDMVAKGLLEQIGKGRDATFALKRKGRERLAQLFAAANAD